MKMFHRFLWSCIAILLLSAASLAAQASGSSAGSTATPALPSSSFKTSLSLGIGAETLNDPTQVGSGTFPVTYQMLTLSPDIRIGKFGMGLDVTLNYRFNQGTDIYGNSTNQVIYVRPQDWVPIPVTAQSILALYLPKIRYVSWGQKGDPLYVKFGQLDSSTLGNGFIVDGYTNTLFLPDQRFFGFNFDLDGRLFNFPYVGLESFVDDVTTFDVGGGEVYIRPLAGLGTPILSGLRLGVVAAVDRNPYKFLSQSQYPFTATPPTEVAIFGGDLTLPILSSPLFSVVAMGSIAREPESFGEMVGLGGRMFGLLTYTAQIRFLGNNFVPSYFDSTYDAFRLQRYQIVTGQVSQPGSVGYLASLGFSMLADRVVFEATVDGPFEAPPSGSTSIAAYPHFKAIFEVKPGILPGFSFDASYEKFMIQSFGSLGNTNDLFNPTNSVIGATVNYQTGPAVITLFYNLTYNPNAAPGTTPWQVTSGLGSSISLF